MRICWDNLESVWLSKRGNLNIGMNTYDEMEACEVCGESYLTHRCNPGLFCSLHCAGIGKDKISLSKHWRGVLNPRYKGGVTKAGLTTYDTHKDTLGLYEDIRKQEGAETLEVKCAYCGRWHAPMYENVVSRLKAINNLGKDEMRLYCSESCKLACPTYGKIKYPKGFKHTTSREVDPYLRQMVFELDNWECQICGASGINVTLHCHHVLGYTQNRMFANDVNNCITLCKACHKMVHSRIGCRYIDLVCK